MPSKTKLLTEYSKNVDTNVSMGCFPAPYVVSTHIFYTIKHH